MSLIGFVYILKILRENKKNKNKRIIIINLKCCIHTRDRESKTKEEQRKIHTYGLIT